jgi:8-oxo-(d)GTP phosphatase
MKIFIQDIPVNIVSSEDLIDSSQFDQLIDGKISRLNLNELRDDVLIRRASKKQVEEFMMYLKQNEVKKLEGITFSVDNYREVIDHVKSEYTIIEAAGGLVLKQGQALMIFRTKKWDLPKGKVESGEKPKEAAVREVMEECNIKVKLGRKIGHTWHTYKRNDEKMLKKTWWYSMYCIDDSEMRPEVQEDIQELRWMDDRTLRQAFYNTYASIRYVFRQYYRLF